jgi:hypothetical protein
MLHERSEAQDHTLGKSTETETETDWWLPGAGERGKVRKTA